MTDCHRTPVPSRGKETTGAAGTGPLVEIFYSLRFLGSPTIRVGGRDVDPHTKDRDDYALSCRVFRTDAGIVGQPDERWVRGALLREAGVLA